MADKCTCGAELLAESRFCHRCGRPVRESDLAAVEPPAEPPLPPVAPSLPREGPALSDAASIDFHNWLAVRLAFIFGAGAALLSSLPVVQMCCVVWLLGGGFAAVYLYQLRSGFTLSVRSAMQLGWITGVFSFAVMLVMFTISLLWLNSRPGGIAGIYREQLSERDMSEEKIEQALQLLESTTGITIIILLSILFLFLFSALLPVAGAALAAKASRRE